MITNQLQTMTNIEGICCLMLFGFESEGTCLIMTQTFAFTILVCMPLIELIDLNYYWRNCDKVLL